VQRQTIGCYSVLQGNFVIFREIPRKSVNSAAEGKFRSSARNSAARRKYSLYEDKPAQKANDAVFSAESFLYVIGSGEDVGDGESRRQRVRRPRHFWVHNAHIGIDA
jgi:hypothetical protein